jgi:uncharacterized protein with HEPN domain
MQPRSIRVRLIDIRQEIAGIQQLTKGADLDAFVASWGMKRAVEHGLLIIAEAAKNLPGFLKTTHPEVPWHKINGLGNLLRHEYRRIDPDVLWSIVTEHLTALDAAAAAMLQDLDAE